jgi:prepilin-type N-terminal cleavage/methylation domain-containing protein
MLHIQSVNRRKARGFTLVEMMIVVVMIGILSVLAVAGYRMLINSSHVTEAQAMVNNIAVAQEEYHSETQTYANVSNSLTSYYPQAAPAGNLITAWGAACGGQCTATDWSALPVHVDGPVYFGYATVAGPAGSNPTPSDLTVNGQSIPLPTPSTVDWFIVGAMCDLDNLGTPNTVVYRTSWQNTVFVSNEGQ